jgi:hypothetical protein
MFIASGALCLSAGALDHRARADCGGCEGRKMRKKAPKAKKPAPKPPTFIEALRAAVKPVRKKCKHQVSGVNSGRLSCRDFGLI